MTHSQTFIADLNAAIKAAEAASNLAAEQLGHARREFEAADKRVTQLVELANMTPALVDLYYRMSFGPVESDDTVEADAAAWCRDHPYTADATP